MGRRLLVWLTAALCVLGMMPEALAAPTAAGSGAKAAGAATAPNVADPPVSANLVALAPARLLDTRSTARVPAGGVRAVQVLGKGGVPATGVAAVVINVTAVRPSATGWLAAYPAGAARPSGSTLNFAAAQTIANQAVVKVGSNGAITLFSSASTDLLVDVSGFYAAGAGFTALSSTRVLDTRSSSTHPRAGSVTTLAVTGRAGVPAAGVTGVLVNVTVVRPAASGWAQLYPHGTARPSTSTVNYLTGRTVAAAAIATPDASGRVNIYTSAGADILVDVVGWIAKDTTFVPITPVRAMDSRYGVGVTRVRVHPAGWATVRIAGAKGLPASGVVAIQATVTAVRPSTGGYLTAFPADGPSGSPPNASSVNFASGVTTANAVTLKLGWNGSVSVFSSAETDVLLDVTGYWAKSNNLVSQITMGDEHACALSAAGRVRCWGNNYAGQLGLGEDEIHTGVILRPREVLGMTEVKSVAAGSFHTCAVRRDGSVWCWGEADHRQLGVASLAWSPIPGRVPGIPGPALSVSASGDHTCAVLVSGGVACWGSNDLGQSGQPASPNAGPGVVPGLENVVKVALDRDRSCALTSAGKVLCWGLSYRNSLGNGDFDASRTKFSAKPVPVGGLPANATDLMLSGNSCVATASGAMRCWGEGQSPTNPVTFSPITLIEPVAAVTRGQAGSPCAVLASGAAWCDIYTYSGSGTDVGISAGYIYGLHSDVVGMASADKATCVLLTGGDVRCWGSRLAVGLLGDGVQWGYSFEPVTVLGLD